MDLNNLRGENVLKVITDLPNFNWSIYKTGLLENINPRIHALIFAIYQNKKPRDEIDWYKPVEVNDDFSLDNLNFVKERNGKMIGLTSKVQLGDPYESHNHQYAHIPMIDFDTHEDFGFMAENKLLELIKTKIKGKLHLKKGLILRSGPKRNYHFLGIGRLLSKEELVTFAGLCLLMEHQREDGKKVSLVDTRNIGHMLTALDYMKDLHNPLRLATAYTYKERFMTLRLTPKPGYDDMPRVVDVLK